MNRHFRFIFSFVAFLGLLAAGCATKYQPPQSDSSAAVVEAVAPLWIVKIDGLPVSQMNLSGDKKLTISPGEHLLELQYSGREWREYQNSLGTHRGFSTAKRSEKNLQFRFTAAAQKHYYVHSGMIANYWQPYVDEQAPNSFPATPTP